MVTIDAEQAALSALDARDNIAILADIEGLATLWDLDRQEETQLLDAHLEFINTALLADPPETAITTSQDGYAFVWKVADGSLIDTLAHGANVKDACYSKDKNTILTVTSDGKVRKWSSENYRLQDTIDLSKPLTAGRFFADDEKMLIGTSADTLYVLANRKPYEVLRTVSIGSMVNAIATSPSFAVIATDDGRLLCMNEEGYIYHELFSEDSDPILSVAVYQDMIVSGSNGGKIQVWRNERTPLGGFLRKINPLKSE